MEAKFSKLPSKDCKGIGVITSGLVTRFGFLQQPVMKEPRRHPKIHSAQY